MARNKKCLAVERPVFESFDGRQRVLDDDDERENARASQKTAIRRFAADRGDLAPGTRTRATPETSLDSIAPDWSVAWTRAASSGHARRAIIKQHAGLANENGDWPCDGMLFADTSLRGKVAFSS